MMRYKCFGNTGLRVSELCLGTMTFGDEFGWGVSKKESRKVFDRFMEKGGNFFDTANIYTKGTSERFLGEFIKGKRAECIIATKFAFSTDQENLNSGGNHRKCIVESVTQSLSRLGSDYIDILWVHVWDKMTPIQEMMRALDDLVKAGKVLYIAASDTPSWVVSYANMMAEKMGWTPFSAVQLEYNLLERSIERDFFEMAELLDLTICPWSPLAMGTLTGKYLTKDSDDNRFANMEKWKKRYLTERNQEIVKKLVDLSEQNGRSPAQIALRWILQKNPRLIPIVGAKNLEQLDHNLEIIDFSLSDEEMTLLDLETKVPLGFPAEFIQREGVQDMLYGQKRSNLLFR